MAILQLFKKWADIFVHQALLLITILSGIVMIGQLSPRNQLIGAAFHEANLVSVYDYANFQQICIDCGACVVVLLVRTGLNKLFWNIMRCAHWYLCLLIT